MKLSQDEKQSLHFHEDESEDIKIYEFLFKTYFNRLCKMAFRLVKDKDVCEDIVQDVFVKIWKKRNELDINLSLKSYLYKATYNTALNYLEHQKRNMPIDDFVAETNKMGTASVDQQIQFSEVQKVMEESLDLLPPKCKAIFILIKYENLSYAEAAKTLDISVKTVENQMGKALKHMRQHLQNYLGYMLMLLSSLC